MESDDVVYDQSKSDNLLSSTIDATHSGGGHWESSGLSGMLADTQSRKSGGWRRTVVVVVGLEVVCIQIVSDCSSDARFIVGEPLLWSEAK